MTIKKIFALSLCLCAFSAQARQTRNSLEIPPVVNTVRNPLLQEARAWLGSGNPFKTRGPWCDLWLKLILQRAHLHVPAFGTVSGFLTLPQVHTPFSGAIVIFRRATHVGLVEWVDNLGLHIISGNYSGRVRRAIIPRNAAMMFVSPF